MPGCQPFQIDGHEYPQLPGCEGDSPGCYACAGRKVHETPLEDVDENTADEFDRTRIAMNAEAVHSAKVSLFRAGHPIPYPSERPRSH